ncbi:MAG: hypothetical protein MI749_04975 [Desulfovibrionales bacterium]|nr:hypothetical protein [Desulfovibrionales bacterium]
MFDDFTSWFEAVIHSKTLSEGIANFISATYGQFALIFIFFMLIIIYLRVLFGPKGFFREKKWDEWNEAAKREKEAQKAARKAAEDAKGKK